jgi:hypothetical protein
MGEDCKSFEELFSAPPSIAAALVEETHCLESLG